ncbi:MAG: nitronate monooxygenase [Deltaproteobacteria bacterium]|nr:nitronate monooxygenase [Deltaproteobacteria bacterium]MBW2417806.1 nitronate monooxygenase [Deltaproteobacteria bacterium]
MAGDPLHTRLCEMLGVDYPIVAFTHCREVAVAAIRAGGFAVLGEAMKTIEELEDDLRWLRERLGDKPFGIDLVLPKSAPPTKSPQEFIAEIPARHSDFAQRIKDKYQVPEPKGTVALHQWGGLTQEMGRAQIDLLLEERVPVIATGLGSPDFLMDAAHERGLMVWGLIGQPRQAALQLERGVDAVVAQGYDAAGHTGAMGTFSIVPAVVDIAGDTPVIAAGGVTSGRHLAAALCLGAAGVWPGTVWLASQESDVDPLVKQRILAATGDDTTRTACISGKTMRILRCPWTEEWDEPGAPPLLATPYQMLLSAEYLQAANDHRRADLMTEAVGQGVAFVRDTRGTGEILLDMAEEARDILLAIAGRGGKAVGR